MRRNARSFWPICSMRPRCQTGNVVITTNVGGLLIGTAIGVAGGAILGGMAAAQAGGDVWKGILLGGLIGGVSAFIGGALGGMAFNAIGTAGKFATYSAFITQGIIQGSF